jgi:hypothetical protein
MTRPRPIAGIATALTSALFLAVAASAASAHDDHCTAVTESVVEAGFDTRVTVTCTDSHAIIQSDTYPDHKKMTGIVGTNEQGPLPADYAAPILLSPTLGDTPLTRDAALGVSVNGVPIYDYTGGGEISEADLAHHQAQHDTLQTGQLDVCGGHAGRSDDYHYHCLTSAPTGNRREVGSRGMGRLDQANWGLSRSSAERAWPSMPSVRLIRAVRSASSCEASALQRCQVTVLANLCTDSPPV